MWRGAKCFSGRGGRYVPGVLVVVAVCLCASAGSAGAATPTAITEFPVDVGHGTDVEGLIVGLDGTPWYQEHWWPEGSYHALIGHMDEAGAAKEFDEGLTHYSSPDEFVVGPDGDLWFADDGSAIGGAAIGKISPEGAITRFTVGLGESRPRRIVVGPDGNLWFTGLGESPSIGFATPEGAISAFALPARPRDLVSGPDGNIWFTYGGESVAPAIGRLVMQEDGGAVVTLFHAGLAAASQPFEIVAGQNGYLWFSDVSNTPAIGRVSMSGEIKEFRNGLNQEGSIWDIALGPGGYIWFTNRGANGIGWVSEQGQITEFGNSELVEPRDIAAGPDGNMWFTFWRGIGKVSPQGEITSLRGKIAPDSDPREIVSGPDGRLWFVSYGESAIPSIGRIIPGDDRSAPEPEPAYEAPNPSFALGRLALQQGSARVSRRGKIVLRLACQSSSQCSGNLLLGAYRKGWRARRTVGSTSYSIGAWGSVGVRIQINRAGRDLLGQGGDVTFRLQTKPTTTDRPLNQQLKLRLGGP
jgi:streptogramin lyase